MYCMYIYENISLTQKSDDGDTRPVAAIFREPVDGANRWADRLYARSRGESLKGAALR